MHHVRLVFSISGPVMIITSISHRLTFCFVSEVTSTLSSPMIPRHSWCSFHREKKCLRLSMFWMELSLERGAVPRLSHGLVQANAWETISPSSGTAPSARTYHTGVWDATNGRMWIFGGSDGPLLSVVQHAHLVVTCQKLGWCR